MQDLPETEGYMGGVGNGLGLCEFYFHFIDFKGLIFTEAEHHATLDSLNQDDEPVKPIELDVGPALWVDMFLDEKDKVDEVDIGF